MANATAATKRPATATYVTKAPEWGTSKLLVWGDPLSGEWEDTDAVWSIGVLAAYPTLPSPPVGATHVEVGYGQLHVVDASGKALAYLEEGVWVAT